MSGTRKVIFWIHLLVGVSASLVILVMSLTGFLLMYQRQITAWADARALRQISSSSSQVLSMDELSERVSQNNASTPTSITIKSAPGSPVVFSFGRETSIFVDPYTGEILGEGSKPVRAFFQSMVQWHRWLALKGDWRERGKWITGAANAGFFFLVVSGLYLWWPRSWTLRAFRAITWFNWSARGKARDWNWHNVVGFWCAVPLAVVTFTALFFSYPSATNFLYKLTGETPPARPSRGAARKQASDETSSPKQLKKSAPQLQGGAPDLLWRTAMNHLPAWQSISLRVPASPKSPWVFTIDQGNGARPDLRGQLTLNPATGAVVNWEGYESQGTARKARTWIRWLHTGEAGGILGQTIAGLASAGGVLLVWTGLSLAVRRFANWRRNEKSRAGFGGVDKEKENSISTI